MENLTIYEFKCANQLQKGLKSKTNLIRKIEKLNPKRGLHLNRSRNSIQNIIKIIFWKTREMWHNSAIRISDILSEVLNFSNLRNK